MRMSPALGSGHDARKVVIFNLPANFNEKDIRMVFKPVGSIMEIDLPRDYNEVPEMEDQQKIYREIMGMEPIDLSYVNFTGAIEPHLFTDFRRFVLREIECLNEMILFKSNNSKQVFNELVRVFEKIRKFKDLLGIAPSALEEEIEVELNNLIGKKSEFGLKNNLSEALEKMRIDFNTVINEFFPIHGYARATFITRNQAERAIVMVNFLNLEHGNLEVHFDRNLPGYFYSSRLIAEAYHREIYKLRYKVESQNKFEIMLNHHIDRFNTRCHVYARLHSEHVGSDEGGDPLILQKAKTEEDSKEVVASVEAIDEYGGNRRDQKYHGNFNSSTREIFSSTDDYYELDVGDNRKLTARGRLHDKSYDYTKKLMTEYILHPNEIPVKKEDVKTLLIVPDLEFPREIPPTRLYSTLKEKLVARQKLLSYQQFFNEPIPSQIEENASILQKERFGDFPNIRYKFEPIYDYLKVSSDNKEKNVRRKYMNELRQKIRNILLDEKENKFTGKLMEVGNEERELNDNIDDVRCATDSDEEIRFAREGENLNVEGMEEDLKENLKNLKKLEVLAPEMSANSHLSYTTSFKYEGKEDINSYVEQLNKINRFSAEHAKNELNEDIVHVAYDNKFKINFEDAKLIFEKYGKQLRDNCEELEVDEEDEERVKRFFNIKISSQELYNELFHQYIEAEMRKDLAKSTNTEKIEKYGQWVNLVEKKIQEEKKTDAIYHTDYSR